MRKLLWLLLLLAPCAVRAQVVGPGFVNYVTSAPSGTCSQGVPAQIVMGAGTLYTCQSGTWGTVGAGTGTVTSIATTSPITGGTITGTGTIACATCVTSAAALTNNQLVFGAGSQASAVGDLTGDVTTSGAKATTLAAQYKILRCYPGLGDGLNAITAGTYLQTNCYNNSGVTWTITRIGCFTDNAGSSTLSATNGAGTALLTGAVTCTAAAGGAAGTQSATVTIANGDVIKFSFVADGTSKQTEWFVSLTQ